MSTEIKRAGMQNEGKKNESERGGGASQKREKNMQQQAGKGQLFLKSTLERFLVLSRDLMSRQTFKITDFISN